MGNAPALFSAAALAGIVVAAVANIAAITAVSQTEREDFIGFPSKVSLIATGQ
jgi:phosphatidylserine synthase